MTTNEPRVAFVTGAASGLGLAIAKRLSNDGLTVVATDRDASIEAVAAQLPGAGTGHKGLVLNVKYADAIAAAMAEVDETYHRLDVLVNCAGIALGGPDGAPGIAGVSEENWHKVIETNLTGPFLLCQAALPLMQRNGWGRIVNIASRAGRTAIEASEVAYAASKAGLIGFTRQLALQVAGSGVTVNAIAPGRFDTPLANVIGEDAVEELAKEIPLGRTGDPAEVAAVVEFLASDDSSYMTGATLDVNGGSFIG